MSDRWLVLIVTFVSALTAQLVTRTTRENGATEVILGSHLWDDEHAPLPEGVTYAEMSPSDCCFVLGNCYYCGGANSTDEYRTALIYAFRRGTCRQEKNQFLAVDREILKKMDYKVQDILG